MLGVLEDGVEAGGVEAGALAAVSPEPVFLLSVGAEDSAAAGLLSVPAVSGAPELFAA